MNYYRGSPLFRLKIGLSTADTFDYENRVKFTATAAAMLYLCLLRYL